MRTCLTTILALLLCTTTTLRGQSVSDACRERLSAPTPDSQIVRVSVRIHPVDSAHVKLPTPYRSLIGAGIKQFFHAPTPLPLSIYNCYTALTSRTNSVASLSLIAYYGGWLHRDGHLTSTQSTGGAHEPLFDTAFLDAVDSLNASGLLPPPEMYGGQLKSDSTYIRLTVAADTVALITRPTLNPPAPGATPLLLLRVPIRHITRVASHLPGGDKLRYPEVMVAKRLKGDVTLAFLVNLDSTADINSLEVIKANYFNFVSAVADVFPSYRFTPLEIEGCPVPSLAVMPFTFRILNTP